MAKIERKTQKIFSLANPTKLGVFGSAQLLSPAISSDLDVLQSAAYDNGWDDAVVSGDKRPPLEEFNGLKYVNDYQNAYLLQEGIPEYDINTNYYIGSIVKQTGTSTIFKSQIDDNNNNALVDGANWKLLGDLANLAEIATLTETNTGTDDTRTITPLKLATGKWGTGVLLNTSVISSPVATVNIINIDSTYKEYLIKIIDLKLATNDNNLRLQVSEDNGATWKVGASDYSWVVRGLSADNKDPSGNAPTSTFIAIATSVTGGGKGIGVGSGYSYSGSIIINNPSSTTTFKNLRSECSFTNTNGFVMGSDINGSYKGTQNAINAVRFLAGTGNIASGIFKLYGVK